MPPSLPWYLSISMVWRGLRLNNVNYLIFCHRVLGARDQFVKQCIRNCSKTSDATEGLAARGPYPPPRTRIVSVCPCTVSERWPSSWPRHRQRLQRFGSLESVLDKEACNVKVIWLKNIWLIIDMINSFEFYKIWILYGFQFDILDLPVYVWLLLLRLCFE